MTSGEFTATLPRKRMSSGVLLSDQHGRVLLIEPAYKPYWEIPGGAVETNESPYAAAQRELREDLGLALRVGRLLVTDWVPPSVDASEVLVQVYDGGVLTPDQTARIRPPANEVRSWGWCTEEEATRRVSEVLSRRIQAAVWARSERAMVYLENGYFVV
ncbi:NUDIX hydrolase [Actinoplanes sp. NPDC051851]|uniref:NUDIX hydrolase n=1 Tax=Actinoplanes sp. NPDC051851 TaxID=3154753 RepID=UPI003439D6F3